MIQFTKLRDFVYSVNLDLGCTYDEIIQDLSNESWTPDRGAYGQGDLVERYYIEWDQIKNPRLQRIQDYACSDGFRRSVIDRLYSEPLFAGHWSIGPNEMFHATASSGRFLRDRPGYHCGLHLDNRLQVASGMIYFANGDDESISTTFYTTEARRDPVRIPTGFGAGWIAANMHDSWHDGWNRGDHDRYSMLLSIGLKLNQ